MKRTREHHPFTVARQWSSLKCLGDVDPCGDGWVIRAVGVVCRVDPEFNIIWRVDFPTEALGLHLQVVTHGELVLTVTKDAGGACSLHAFERASGEPAWTAPVHWTGMNTYGGLVCHAGRLFMAKNEKGMTPSGLILDLENGKVIGAMDAWIADPLNRGIGKANPGFLRAGRHLFSSRRGDGAYRLDLESKAPAFVPIEGIEYARIGGDAETLIILGKHAGEFALMRLDPERLEILERSPRTEADRQWGTIGELRVCAGGTVVLIAERGLHGRRLSAEPSDWSYPFSEGTTFITGGLVVGDSLLFEEHGTATTALVELDWQRGETIATTRSREYFLANGLFAVGESVLAEAVAGYVLFARREAATALPALEPFFPPSRVDVAVTPPPAPPRDTAVDAAFSAVIGAFVSAKAAQEQGRAHKALAKKFNRLFDAFIAAHPGASLASVALSLSKLGVPYEQAFGDVVAMRGAGRDGRS